MSVHRVRPADPDEIDCLARVWYDGWHDAHAHLVPAALTRLRTLSNFAERLHAMIGDVRTIGEVGAAIGFCAIRDDELYQLFVAATGRGTGAATALVADAEHRLASRGVAIAWLACAIGNDRAARFYEKSGWRRVGTMINDAVTSEGTFALKVWRYEKHLTS